MRLVFILSLGMLFLNGGIQACQSPAINKRKAEDDIKKELLDAIAQRLEVLDSASLRRSKRLCLRERAKVVEEILEIEKEAKVKEPFGAYDRLREIFWDPAHLPLLKFSLQNKIIRNDAKFLHPKSFL